MAQHPTHNTIPTRKRSVLRSIKQVLFADPFDAHPVVGWLLALAMAGVMVAVLCAMPGEW